LCLDIFDLRNFLIKKLSVYAFKIFRKVKQKFKNYLFFIAFISLKPIYFCRTFGIFIEPSFCWLFSRIQAIVLSVAIAVLFKVNTNSVSLFVLYFWLGLVIGLHAIPSTGDAKSLFQMANHRFWHNPFVIIAYPFILILYILNLFKRLHIDFLYVGLLFWLAKYYL